ncbi:MULTISPECIES: ribulose-phosphate 3-epimerase [Kitasatospora]|uniref:Ribulose-phosphate 3-epimerase n=1 Tax=Kitasatospora cystarginea TaxID=58350 RepID=A0ABN3DT51_9ACTN
MTAITESPLAVPGLGYPDLSMSVVCLDQTRLGEHIETLQGLGISRLHVDLVDPAFGGGLGLPLETISDLRRNCPLPVDVHIMLSRPELLLTEAASRGAAGICVHQRSLTPKIALLLRGIAAKGTEVGLAIDPDESISMSALEAVRPERLTVMSVVPGGAGRPFRPEALTTVAEARRLRERGLIKRVEVDGAVGPQTADRMVAAGADQLVLGSTVFPNRSPLANHLPELLRSLAGPSHPTS